MKKYTTIGICIFVTVAIWMNSYMQKGGNQSKEIQQNTDAVVMEVGNQKIDVSETMIYMLLWREVIEQQWGTNMWAANTGNDKHGNSITYEDSLKEDIKQEIIIEKTLLQMAEKKGCKISDKEKRACKKEAIVTIRSLKDEDILNYGITLEKVEKYFTNLNLVVNFLKGKKQEIIPCKQEDYLVMTYDKVFLSKDKNISFKDTEQKELSLKKTKNQAKKVEKLLKEGKSVEEVAKKYRLSYMKDKTSLRKLVSEEYHLQGTLEGLNDGDVTSAMETDNGYVILKIVSKVNKELSKKAFCIVTERKERKAFADYYKKHQLDKNYRVKINKEIWEALPLASRE